MLRLGGIYIQTGNRSQTMSRQEFNRCINIWKKAEAWERKWGWLPMADRIANLIKEIEIERDTGRIVHINTRCGAGGPPRV